MCCDRDTYKVQGQQREESYNCLGLGRSEEDVSEEISFEISLAG